MAVVAVETVECVVVVAAYVARVNDSQTSQNRRYCIQMTKQNRDKVYVH